MACCIGERGRVWWPKVLTGVAMGWLCSTSSVLSEEIASTERAVELGADVTSIALQATSGAKLNGIFREARTRRFSLSMTGIAASRPPDASYLVFVNVKDAKDLTATSLGYLGSIAFFGGTTSGAVIRFRPVSFEISEALVRLDQSGHSSLPIVVTLKPTNEPAAGSMPFIGKIGLFAF